jgi:hypothetical protein
MRNQPINPGDVFLGDENRTFARVEVRSQAPSTSYRPRWHCLGTRRNGNVSPVTMYETTLLGRYTREVKPLGFNLQLCDYSRRPGIDIPDSYTDLVRSKEAVLTFIGQVTSTLIHVSKLHDDASQAKSKSAKVALLLDAKGGDLMFLAVPGRHSMDIFLVDDREAALTALGLVKKAPVPPPVVRVAEDGSEWVAA